jgi:hypothetical protein
MNNKENSDIQEQYKELISQKRFTELVHLMNLSQLPPAEYIVRLGYKSYIEEPQGKKVKLFFIMKLKEITNILPSKEILKTSCAISLEADTPEVLESLIRRLDIDKSIIKELESTLQKTYTLYVAEGKFVDISKLMEVTGINPLEEIIHKGYKSYLEESKFISFSGLKKRTGIPPDEGMVQEIYNQYLGQYMLALNKRDAASAQSWLERIIKTERVTKISPQNPTLKELLAQSTPSPAGPQS